MSLYRVRVLVIESRVVYAEPTAKSFEVPKMPVCVEGLVDTARVERWPIHTIRQMKRSPNERVLFANDNPGPYDGVRLAIDPELDPILDLCYRSPQKVELDQLRKSLEFTRTSLDVANETALTYKDQRDAAYGSLEKLHGRVVSFNEMSFWKKLIFIWKGKAV